MELQEFQDKLIKKAKAEGIEEVEVFHQGNKDFEVRIFKGEISHYANSDTRGLSFRGIYKGKMGYAFTEKLEEDVIDTLIGEIKENALINEDEEQDELYEGDSIYPSIESFDSKLREISVSDKIESAKVMEQAAYEYDPRIISVDYSIFEYIEDQIGVKNTKGLSVAHQSNYGIAYASVRAQSNGQIKTGSEYWIGKEWSDFDPMKIGKDAAKAALSCLGAESVPSGSYSILLRNDVAAQLLNTYVSVFFADQVQKGFSMLKGKVEQKIASEVVSVRDHGLYEKGVASCPFDHEGIPTKNKKVIGRGILKTFLYNQKTAKKEGIPSTGNGFKSSYKDSVEIAATNFYIEPGEHSFEEVMKRMGKGLLITDLAGLHSGANTISGDFSLSASGFMIEEGKIGRPIDQITIAGNFFEVLQQIQAVANDLRFQMPSHSGTIGSPSLYIKQLAVAGK